jgi:hypothetical protein
MKIGTKIVSRWIINDTPATIVRIINETNAIVDFGDGEILPIRMSDYRVA